MKKVLKKIFISALLLTTISTTCAYAYGYIASMDLTVRSSIWNSYNSDVSAYTKPGGDNLYSKTSISGKNFKTSTDVSKNGKSSVTGAIFDPFKNTKVTSKHYTSDQYSTLTKSANS